MAQTHPNTPWRLISLPMSHYCEKVRWILDWSCLPYIEEPHLLPFHRKVTQKLGGTTVPVLIAPDQILTDSSEMMQYVDRFIPSRASLYPQETQQLQQLYQLETLFNQTLGPATRSWFYFYALEHKELLQHCLCLGVPEREKALYSRMLPKIDAWVRESLHLSPDSVQQSLERIYQIFEQVEVFLADGRPYLLGESMSVADITLSALASPLLSPPEHPLVIHPTQHLSLPRPMMQEILACRKTLAGDFILRMYHQERHAKFVFTSSP